MNNKIKKRWGLTISLVLFVFAVMMSAMLLAGLIFVILNYTGILILIENAQPDYRGGGSPIRIILPMMTVSILLGTTIAAFFSKKALNPIRKVIDATRQIAEGNFNVQVEMKGIHELEELSRSFNKMANELSSVETLRRDFINNFSHEFKTPIVSIRGFAKLLKDGDLTEEEKQEYLEIIIAESERLAGLSTNVLNLSKYEAIEIITEKTPFRLDEQIRRAIALTETKWADKSLEIDVILEEIVFNGNEDLTQQIWLNLLDNAIKFSNIGGTLHIRLSKWNRGIRFIIQDEGIGMDDKVKSRIFDKFYQGDHSHKKTGNGLGLTMVKRIVDLCGGTVEVESEIDKGSVFTVTLPM